MVTLSEVLDALRTFTQERDWDQFHTPHNLAKSVSIESAELLECFQWSEEADTAALREELADVLTYAFMLAMRIGESPHDLILEKLKITAEKYPANKVRGRSVKYDKL